MSDQGKDLSIQIMEALKPILPKKTGFIMIVGSATEEDIGITSNLPDEIAVDFLNAALKSIETEPAVMLEKETN